PLSSRRAMSIATCAPTAKSPITAAPNRNCIASTLTAPSRSAKRVRRWTRCRMTAAPSLPRSTRRFKMGARCAVARRPRCRRSPHDPSTTPRLNLFQPASTRKEQMMTVLLEEMTRDQIKELAPNAVAVLPTASIEQHGPHLPIVTDTLLCGTVARRAAEAVGDQARVVVAPVLPFGNSHHHRPFAGVLSL